MDKQSKKTYQVNFVQDQMNVNIGDEDDVDSVQHLDISVIGDDLLGFNKPGSQILQQVKAETERAQLRADQ